MIEIATLFTGIILAQVAPGPNLVAVAAASLGTSRAAGLATAAGVATGVFIWSILFALGIGAFLKVFPQTITLMRLVGGGYLLFLAFKALRTACDAGNGQRINNVVIAPGAAWKRGLLVVLTNPKAAMMWVAIALFLASSGLTPLQFVAIGFLAACSAMLVYGSYAVLFSTGVAIRAYERFFRIVETGFGCVFGLVGGKLVIDGLRELRN